MAHERYKLMDDRLPPNLMYAEQHEFNLGVEWADYASDVRRTTNLHGNCKEYIGAVLTSRMHFREAESIRDQARKNAQAREVRRRRY